MAALSSRGLVLLGLAVAVFLCAYLIQDSEPSPTTLDRENEEAVASGSPERSATKKAEVIKAEPRAGSSSETAAGDKEWDAPKGSGKAPAKATQSIVTTCSKRLLSDVDDRLRDLGAKIRKGAVVPESVCFKLRNILERYRKLQRPVERLRARLVQELSLRVLREHRAKLFLQNDTWKKAISKAGEEKRLRDMGIKPFSEAPDVTAKKEHQVWHLVGAETPGFKKSPYYPAIHLVQFEFGKHKELDKPMARYLECNRQCALECALLLSEHLHYKGEAK